MAFAMSPVLTTDLPSSLSATAPAAFMPPMAASSLPSCPLVMAPTGRTLHKFTSFARDKM